jgi:hypothetical protein
MYMNVGRLLNNEYGRIIISIILGLGLATLFRRACSDGKCIEFNGPILSQIDGKIYRFDERCYKYDAEAARCNPNKKTVDMVSPPAVSEQHAKHLGA